MNRRILLAYLFLSFTVSARAATLVEGPLSVAIPDKVEEGQPFLAEVRLEYKADHVYVEWMGKTVEVAMAKGESAYKGEAILGAGLGTRQGQYRIVVESMRPGRKELVLGKVTVTPTLTPEQQLTLAAGMVTMPTDRQGPRQDQERTGAVMASEQERKMWNFPFLRPAKGDVSSAFGLRRFLNGQPRGLHYGVDFEGQIGEEVRAANKGKVILTGSFFYNGHSVFLDHGQGIVTMYFHLSRIMVVSGQHVEKGQVVGLMGSTGRSTGPHLHFGMKILGQAVDPLPLVTQGGQYDARPKGGS